MLLIGSTFLISKNAPELYTWKYGKIVNFTYVYKRKMPAIH